MAIGDVDVSVDAFLLRLHRQGRLISLLHDVAAAVVIESHARSRDIELADVELQRAADHFRLRHGLASAEATQRWLNHQNWASYDFQAAIEQELLREKLAEVLTGDRISEVFESDPGRFKKIHLHQIVAASEDAAMELKQQIEYEGADFLELARTHSLADSQVNGGDLGQLRMDQLPGYLTPLIPADPLGKLIGPVAGGTGFHLYHIEAVYPGELDHHTRTSIREQLFEEWLAEQMKNVRIDLSALRTLDEPDGPG